MTVKNLTKGWLNKIIQTIKWFKELTRSWIIKSMETMENPEKQSEHLSHKNHANTAKTIKVEDKWSQHLTINLQCNHPMLMQFHSHWKDSILGQKSDLYVRWLYNVESQCVQLWLTELQWMLHPPQWQENLDWRKLNFHLFHYDEC